MSTPLRAEAIPIETVSGRPTRAEVLVASLLGLATAVLLAFSIPPVSFWLAALIYGPISLADEPAWINVTLVTLYILYVVSTLVTSCVFTAQSMVWKPKPATPKRTPLVSLLVPALNEEEGIRGTVEHALVQNYPNVEVILIDDGSWDTTVQIAQNYPVTILHHQINLGKAGALNHGLMYARGDFIVCCDADTMLEPDAVSQLVASFEDPSVVAVAGQVLLNISRNPLHWFQLLEYCHAQEIMKRAQEASCGTVTICPGAISAFRRSALQTAKEFSSRTLAEDFDLTLDLIECGGRAIYNPKAVARTDAPSQLKILYKQRLRWCRGTLQVLLRHHSIVGKRRFGWMGLFWVPYTLYVGYGGAFLSLLIVLLAPILIMSTSDPSCIVALGAAYAIPVFAVEAMFYAIAIARSRIGHPYWLLLFLPLNLLYKVFLDLVRAISVFKELFKARQQW